MQDKLMTDMLPTQQFYEFLQKSDPEFQAVKVKLATQRGQPAIVDTDGKFVFSLIFNDSGIFRKNARKWVMSLGFIGFLFLGLGLYRLVRTWLSPGLPELGLVLFFCSLRAVLLLFRIPQSYVTTELFSAKILAINSWNASLGDFGLNVLIGFLVCFYLSRAFFRPVSRAYIRILRSLPASSLLFIFNTSLVGFLFGSFFLIFDSVSQNSRIYLEFINVFQLDIYSLILMVTIGGLLGSTLIVAFQALRFNYHLFRRNPGLAKMLLIPGLIGFLLTFGILAGWDPASLILGFLALAFTFLMILQVKGSLIFKPGLLSLSFVIVIFTCLVTGSVLKSIENSRLSDLNLIANRLTEERDLITESLYGRVLEDIYDQSLILQAGLYPDSILTDFPDWLYRQFFESNFKGYECRVYVFDSTQKRLKSALKIPPLVSLPPTRYPRVMGDSTLSPNLNLVPSRSEMSDFIYLGLFDLSVKDMGRLLVQVEMIPNRYDRDQLYPQLLFEDQVRDRSKVPREFEFAIYKKGYLLRKSNNQAFSLRLESGDTLFSDTPLITREKGLMTINYQPTPDKRVIAQTPLPGLYESINIFSFVFYFFVLAFMAFAFPFWISRVISSGGKRIFEFSLRSKIQVFLFAISVIPLVMVIFLLGPFVKNRFDEDVSKSLARETARLGYLIRDDYAALGQFNLSFPQQYRHLKSRLKELEKEIFKDINVYDNRGKLRFSTQPAIQEMGLTSGLMNPEVFRAFVEGKTSDLVVKEKIGDVEYYSGYYPLTTVDRKILGFLNIPYLSQQDEVNEQSLSLMSFLIDIYVIVFLVIGFVGFVLSNSITRPLNLLREKLEQTTLGKRNQPIEWDSNDEIGEIIKSYNYMLEKMEESEKRLAKSERESAWKQMARQVAHEIKNPLTPMRLSIQHLVRSYKARPEGLDEKTEKVMKTLLVQIDSLVNIANSFSEFARMPEPQKTVFNLIEILQEVAELYSHDEKVQIELHFPTDEIFVDSDRDQLSRVLNNLIKNAIQAMEEGKGKIEIGLKKLGTKVIAEFKDNGKGIPDELKDKIFQPDFSTKTSGMGLGLAMAKQIVENTGGIIYFTSEIDVGTTFYIELPMAGNAG